MHIVLADDHDLVRDGLRAHVQALAADARISDARTCAEVLAFVGSVPPPDLILLDLNMPGMIDGATSHADGIAGVKAVTRAFPGVPVVVVSGYSDSSTVTAALRSGARGFVPKTSGSGILLSALRRVLGGDVFIPEMSAIEREVPTPGQLVSGTDELPLERVSAREATVLRLLTRGLTNKEIALQLGLKEITVKVHLQHAYRKIGAANRADAVRIILQAAPAALPTSG